MEMLKRLWNKAIRSWTVYSASIVVILGIIQANLNYFHLDDTQQGLTLIVIGIITTLARLRPKKPGME